jgi:quercetin dioxygenase-like cupin family protein
VPEEISDPNTGQRVVFRRTGDVLELDLYVSRGAYVARHMHPSQEETFTGVTGTLVLNVGDETKTIGPGDSVTIPARTPHGFDPAVDDAHLVVTVSPGLELDRYFRAYLGLSREGRLRVPARGLPKPLLLFAVLLHRYRREMAAPGIPLWLQRPLIAVMAFVGRLLRRRESYPEYGAP